jgi:Fe-S-cluster-containing dehydrogenase component
MVLRRLGKEEYIWRRGMKDYVKEYRASDLPQLKSLSYISSNAIVNDKYLKLHDDASLCQWCKNAPCQNSCPFEYDIRGILRRIEVGNYQGAFNMLRDGKKKNTSTDIHCIDCTAPCDEACKEKNGNTPPVKIKNIFVSLAGFQKSEKA